MMTREELDKLVEDWLEEDRERFARRKFFMPWDWFVISQTRIGESFEQAEFRLRREA